VLGSLSLAYAARLTRTNLSENLRADYVRTAVAKGLTEASRHRRPRPAQLDDPGGHLPRFRLRRPARRRDRHRGIFNIPGVGGYIFRSIHNRDGVAVVGAVTMLVIVYLFMNLIVDLLYGVLDPRISHD
jgi:oligopeptide transport system permease protein